MPKSQEQQFSQHTIKNEATRIEKTLWLMASSVEA